MATPSENVLTDEDLDAIATCRGELSAFVRHAGKSEEMHRTALEHGTVLSPLLGIVHASASPFDALARSPELPQTDSQALASTLTAALRLLDEAWPQAAREVQYFVRAIVSGRLPSGRQSSGSSAACPFVVRIDLCADDPPHLLADALVHEAAHVKLRLSQVVAACCSPDGEIVGHPWRPGPRPLEATLVASHAFVAVHGFYARLRTTSDAVAAELEPNLRAEVAGALATARGARGLTPFGVRFVERMAEAFAVSAAIAGHAGPRRP